MGLEPDAQVLADSKEATSNGKHKLGRPVAFTINSGDADGNIQTTSTADLGYVLY